MYMYIYILIYVLILISRLKTLPNKHIKYLSVWIQQIVTLLKAIKTKISSIYLIDISTMIYF
jgi:hypothetical protein